MSRFLDDPVEDPLEINVGSAEKSFHTDLASDRTILDLGEEATVFGIKLANSSNKDVEVTGKNAAGATKLTITVPKKDTIIDPVKFVTSGGLVLEGLPGAEAADVFASVFYTAGVV